jgi:raffinose/stachyose/melibiose transport system substrate-binding protein
MKHKASWFFLLVIVTLSLAACSSATEAATGPAATEASSEEVNLTMGSWRVDDTAGWAKIITKFNETYPNIKIKFDPTTPTEYNATLRTQLESGTGPDLFFVRSFATGLELYTNGYLEALDSLPGLKDNIPAAANAPWATEDGVPYAVPIAAVSHGIYYNQDMFEQNGIEVPKTWEELLEAAEKLKAAGVIPVANGTKDGWDINEVVLMAIIPNTIGGLDGRMGYLTGKTCFNDPNIVAAFQAIGDLEPYVPEGFAATSYYDSEQLFAQGKAAMLFDGSWAIGTIKNEEPEFKWSVLAVPPPAGKDQYISFHMDAAIGVNGASKNKDAAKTFLQWLETKDFAEVFGNEIPGFFPVSKNVPTLQDDVAATFMGFNAQAKGTDIRFAWQKLLDGKPDAYGLMQEGAIAVLKREMTPQQAADALQDGLAQWFEPAKTCTK